MGAAVLSNNEKMIFDTASFLSIDEQIQADKTLRELYNKTSQKVLIKMIYIEDNTKADLIGSIEKNFNSESRKMILIVRKEKSVDIFAVNAPKELTAVIKDMYYQAISNSNSYTEELNNFKGIYIKNSNNILKILNTKSSVGLWEIIVSRDIDVYIKLFGIVAILGISFLALTIFLIRRKNEWEQRKTIWR